MRVLVFGDSIAHGFYDSRGGWVQRLANTEHMKTLDALNQGDDYYVEVHNLGISGDDANGVLKRMQHEVEARRLYDAEEIIVLAIGTNDAVLRKNIALTDVYDFEMIYEKIVEQAQKLVPRVISIGLPAVDESQSDPWKFSKTGRQYKNNRLNLFEDTVKQVAERNDVPFVPIFDQFWAALQAGQDLLADGLHPNDAGHELMYQMIRPALKELYV